MKTKCLHYEGKPKFTYHQARMLYNAANDYSKSLGAFFRAVNDPEIFGKQFQQVSRRKDDDFNFLWGMIQFSEFFIDFDELKAIIRETKKATQRENFIDPLNFGNIMLFWNLLEMITDK